MSSSRIDRRFEIVDKPVVWLTRRLRSLPSAGIGDTIRVQVRAYEQAVILVRAFYAISLMFVAREHGSFLTVRGSEVIDPQWPAGWLERFGQSQGIDLILASFAVSTVAAAFFPKWRTARLAFSVTLLQYLAIKYGFGKINHSLHGWFWVSAFMVFLPTARGWDARSARSRQMVLGTFWSAQVMVLFFYTLTGLWKLYFAFYDLTTDRVSALELRGFSLITANRILATDQETLLGEFLVEHQVIGWALFNGTMYLETVALLIAFRPRLHRLFGAGLIMFHLGTLVAMGFTFSENIALVGLLFLCSPLAPERVRFTEALLDLPGVHFVSNALRRRRTRSRAEPPPPSAEAITLTSP